MPRVKQEAHNHNPKDAEKQQTTAEGGVPPAPPASASPTAPAQPQPHQPQGAPEAAGAPESDDQQPDDASLPASGPWLPDKIDFPEIPHPKKRAFLAAMSLYGVITRAAEVAGIDPKTHRNWLGADEVYAEAFGRAKQAAVDTLEAEARRRAVEGVQEPVFYEGRVVGHKMRQSDNLAMFLLKGNAPDKFRERSEVKVTGHLSLSAALREMSEEELQRLAHATGDEGE